MKAFRTDAPRTNPAFRVGPNKRPRLDGSMRTDDDRRDRLAARRDAALADVRGQYKRNRGYTRDDLREGPTKAEAAPKPTMDADSAREAIKAQSRGGKA